MQNDIMIYTTISADQYIREHQEMALSTHQELSALPHMFKILPLEITGARPESILIEVSI